MTNAKIEMFKRMLKNEPNNWSEEIKKYPEGKEVLIYYDPAYPSLGILENTNLGLWVWVQVFCTLCLSLMSPFAFSIFYR